MSRSVKPYRRGKGIVVADGDGCGLCGERKWEADRVSGGESSEWGTGEDSLGGQERGCAG